MKIFSEEEEEDEEDEAIAQFPFEFILNNDYLFTINYLIVNYCNYITQDGDLFLKKKKMKKP